MKKLEDFKKIMKAQTTVALATSMNQQPNVRIVNFITRENKPDIIYFATFKGNTKEKEFEHNDKVAFTTIPNEMIAHIKVSSGTVIKSDLSIHDLAGDFVSKIPDYKDIIEFGAEALVIYEVHFSKASVILDYNNISVLEF